jgi:hypothetical protein
VVWADDTHVLVAVGSRVSAFTFVVRFADTLLLQVLLMRLACCSNTICQLS